MQAGMSFDLTPAQLALLAEAKAFGAVAARVERAPSRVDRRLVRELADAGLLPRLFPSRAGGSREDDRVAALELCLIREGLAQASVDAETALAMQGLAGYPILLSGSAELIRRWVPPIARGEAVGAFALTEPDAGSDAGSLQLRAEPDGEGVWRLFGEKTWISNAPEADVYVVFARTTADAGPRGVTAFTVPGDVDGLSGRSLEILGDHPIGRLRFEGVRVSRDDVLGGVDRGFRVAMGTLDLFRPSVGAFAVGMAQAALDLAVRHAGVRIQFGRPLRELQAVSHLVAEMATRIEAARLLVYRAAVAYDQGREGITRTSAMAKLFATESAQFVVDGAMQIHGAKGLEKGHPLERLYRAVRSPRIYEGTTEIQREVIARELFRP
jgi:alkylation response protein AidB-like acyl-CoA dehydrogenase